MPMYHPRYSWYQTHRILLLVTVSSDHTLTAFNSSSKAGAGVATGSSSMMGNTNSMLRITLLLPFYIAPNALLLLLNVVKLWSVGGIMHFMQGILFDAINARRC